MAITCYDVVTAYLMEFTLRSVLSCIFISVNGIWIAY